MAAVGLVVGVVTVASFVLGDAPEDHAIDLVPADAAFYATVHLDPSLGQKRATQNVLDRATEAGAGEGTTTSLDDAISALVGSTPVDYERDVKPYGGSQLAIFVRAGESPTLLVDTENPRGSRQAMRRMLESEYPGYYYRIVRSAYRGRQYEHVVYSEGGGSPSGPVAFTIVDGFVVIGGERDVMGSINASYGASLAGLDRFARARSKLSDDVLAFAYLDAEPLVEAAVADEYATSDETAPLETIADVGPIAATLTGRDSSLELDLAARGSSGDAGLLKNPSALLETLPAEAIGAISFGDLGGPLRGTPSSGIDGSVNMLRDSIADLAELDLDSDIAPWLGQLGLYIAGDDPDTVESALVAETRSPQGSDRVLDRIENYYSSDDYYGFDSYVYGSDDGLGFDVVDGESVLQVRGDDDRVVAGSGEAGFSTDRALDADGGFGESAVYRRAAGLLGGYEPFLVIDAPPMQRLLEQLTDAEYDEVYMDDVRQWLSSVDTVAAGVRTDGDDIRIRLAVEVGQAGTR